MDALIGSLTEAMAPWIDFYSSSAATETLVMFLHLGGLLAAGGLAFTLDRAVLRSRLAVTEGRARLALELHQSHRVVILGLGVITFSGVLLTAADPEVFLGSPIYWAKMGIVALLLANGWFLKRSGEQLMERPEDDGVFSRLRSAALRSAALWAFALLGGVAITMYA